ncbi:MAG: DUF1549 domain-containing protein, partial [Verrucomicrobiota bacterium]|nr:DUF1549 domain-containing protein [Verrucomicrobiota bacterium]
MIRFLILFFAGGWFLQLSGEDLHEDVHWAFVPPLLPQMPEVRDTAWPRQPIDHFILHALEKHGLKPSIQADKTTILRRVWFGLTGLPPSPEAVDAFLEDDDERAIERVVDGLLASPHYGERWGRHWLDV